MLYKYVPLSFYTSQKLSEQSQEKFRVDIIKQLTYELAIQQTHKVLENWFFIPYFYESAPLPFLLGKVATEVGEISTSVRTLTGQYTNIKIFKANFLFIQKVYLDENS